MIWSLRVANGAKRALRALPEHDRRDISVALRSLADDPYPDDSIALRGHDRYRRLKVPPFRVLYRVGNNTVYILRIEKRTGRTYRGFNPE